MGLIMRSAPLLAAALLLLLLLLGAAPPAAAAGEWGVPEEGMQGVIRLEDGTVIQLQEFRGPSRWAAATRHLFDSAAVAVDCPGLKDYAVYAGPSVAAVRAAYGRRDKAWCGWDSLLAGGGAGARCLTPAAPYGTTVVAVAKPRGWLGTTGGAAAAAPCSMEWQQAFSMPRFLSVILGSFLLWSAPALSESTPFRLTGGTLGFVALSLVVVMFVIYRSVPHKRSVFAGAALFGSTFLAGVRYAFGTWLPSAGQLAHSPVVLGYAALSGLAGLALTYYYDNPHNRKVNTMLRVALQLVGVGLVALGPSLPEGKLALVLALLGARAASFLSRQRSWRGAVQRAKQAYRAQLEGEEEAPPGRHVRAVRTSLDRPAVRAERAPATPPAPVPAPAAAPPKLSPLVERGLILNEETGHTITIGKARYTELVSKGYVVDKVAGTLTPPPAGPKGGSGGRAGARRRRS